MSYRELRDATEMLRALSYPRLVSIDNFRLPNFPLMAEMLEWTVRKFEPNARLPRQIDAEADRVLFIKSAVLTLLQKAHVRLNPKQLYQSDGHAIRELLPVLRMLYESVNEQRRKGTQPLASAGGADSAAADDSVHIGALRSQVNAKRQELRAAVRLAAELPKAGANLYELLRDEAFAREVRARALGRTLNATQVEAEVRERIQTTERRIGEVRERLGNIAQDEQELGRKIERRRREMDQLQKRLAKLQAFRPPYMDEYERYEAELRERYSEYVSLFRNLHALQHQLAQSERAERERAQDAERAMRVAVERMRMESEQQTAPAIAGLSGTLPEEDEPEAEETLKRQVRVFGNMTGMDLSDDEEEEEEEDEMEGMRMMEVEEDEEEEEEEEKMRMKREAAEETEEEEDHSGDNF